MLSAANPPVLQFPGNNSGAPLAEGLILSPGSWFRNTKFAAATSGTEQIFNKDSSGRPLLSLTNNGTIHILSNLKS